LNIHSRSDGLHEGEEEQSGCHVFFRLLGGFPPFAELTGRRTCMLSSPAVSLVRLLGFGLAVLLI
jgi:hypothetical protein